MRSCTPSYLPIKTVPSNSGKKLFYLKGLLGHSAPVSYSPCPTIIPTCTELPPGSAQLVYSAPRASKRPRRCYELGPLEKRVDYPSDVFQRTHPSIDTLLTQPHAPTRAGADATET